ncbi:MAG: hypothetical protein KBD53_10780 [Candidatus Omnitrophica bacterium]|nr:hypothetical protein [Candidatus Omnitrophota bacterium]
MKVKSLNEIRDKIIQFDSCTAMLTALSNYLKGKPFKGVGVAENVPSSVGKCLNAIPNKIRGEIYRWSGYFDALPENKLHDLKSEEIAHWVTSRYPKGKFPGAIFGSSNGAAIHLAAALAIPWLPQTFLIAMRRKMEADELKKDVDWGRDAIKPFLKANPQLFVHQMHDPLQDRLMVTKMGYFRIKFLSLEEPYHQFLNENLIPRSPIISIECKYLWPSYKVQDRHYFQIGGFGGLSAKEYLDGGEEVTQFLKRVNAPVKKWDFYPPEHEIPEAEWGFREEALVSYKEFADKNNLPFYRLQFCDPEDLSPFVADLYQWWYTKRNCRSDKILIENFGLLEPYWAIRSRSVPLWLTFNTLCSYEVAKKYLTNNSFEMAYLMLMSNGVKEGVGLTTIEYWRKILSLAHSSGEFIGVNEDLYPSDFGTFLKYHEDLKKKLPLYDDPIQPLTFQEFEQFLVEKAGRYAVKWHQY